jgi:hypothetical protein
MAAHDVGDRQAGQWGLVAVCWTIVGVPLLWGVWNTLVKASALFK